MLQPCLGTNPIALGAPGNDGDSFVLDMATSAVALGKVHMIHCLNAINCILCSTHNFPITVVVILFFFYISDSYHIFPEHVSLNKEN